MLVVGVAIVPNPQELRIRGLRVAANRLMAQMLGYSRSIGIRVAPVIIMAGDLKRGDFLFYMSTRGDFHYETKKDTYYSIRHAYGD